MKFRRSHMRTKYIEGYDLDPRGQPGSLRTTEEDLRHNKA